MPGFPLLKKKRADILGQREYGILVLWFLMLVRITDRLKLARRTQELRTRQRLRLKPGVQKNIRSSPEVHRGRCSEDGTECYFAIFYFQYVPF